MPDSSRQPPQSPPPVPPTSLLALTAPVAMGYIPLGTVFGFLFVQAGGHWALAWLSSLLIYAGAAQYMMIPMLAAGMPLAAIALATLVVNLRHIFYGLSLLERLPPSRLLRGYAVCLDWALASKALVMLALLAVTSIPWLARNFGFLPLTPLQWLAALAAGVAMVPLLHLSKVILIRRPGPVVSLSTP